jgi:hypothetical protein
MLGMYRQHASQQVEWMNRRADSLFGDATGRAGLATDADPRGGELAVTEETGTMSKRGRTRLRGPRALDPHADPLAGSMVRHVPRPLSRTPIIARSIPNTHWTRPRSATRSDLIDADAIANAEAHGEARDKDFHERLLMASPGDGTPSNPVRMAPNTAIRVYRATNVHANATRNEMAGVGGDGAGISVAPPRQELDRRPQGIPERGPLAHEIAAARQQQQQQRHRDQQDDDEEEGGHAGSEGGESGPGPGGVGERPGSSLSVSASTQPPRVVAFAEAGATPQLDIAKAHMIRAMELVSGEVPDVDEDSDSTDDDGTGDAFDRAGGSSGASSMRLRRSYDPTEPAPAPRSL